MNGANAMNSANSTNADDQILKFGKYKLLAKLGEGGMAEVYVGYADEKTSLGKLVVLKVLRDSLAADSDAVEMFLDEARLASRLHHANVVHVYEAGASDGRYAIVMEYLSGAPLSLIRRRALAAGTPLDPAVGMRILCDALRGLDHAHDIEDEKGAHLCVVHRDFTASNIFITTDGHTKVLDFGISKARDHISQTREGFLKGTAGYIAPESIAGHPIDRRADIFAAGAVLWTLLSGQKIWRGVNNVAILQKTIAGEFPPWPEGVEVDPNLEEVCRRAMARDPEDRFDTAEDMRIAIREAMLPYGGLAESEKVAELVREIVGTECDERSRIFRRRLVEERDGTGAGLVEFPEFTDSGRSTDSTMMPIPSAIVQNPMHAQPQKSSLGLFAGMAVIAALVAGGVVFAMGGRGGSEEAAAAAAEPATQPAAASATPAPSSNGPMVTVIASASPSEAKIYLDDKLLPGNPTQIALPSDTDDHEMRIMARGYRTEFLTIRLTGPVRTAITLQKLGVNAAADEAAAEAEAKRPVGSTMMRPRRPSRPAASSTPAPAAPTPAPSPSTSSKTKSGARGIDSDNPWK